MGCRNVRRSLKLKALHRFTSTATAVEEITAHFRAGRRAEAVAAVPDELVDEVAIIGDREQVREGVRTWRKAGVDTLLVGCRDVAAVRSVADAVLGAEDGTLPSS